MKLILMRHPPVIDGNDRCYGRLDLAADTTKIPDSLAILAPLYGMPVYSSPARRCRQLADAFCEEVIIWDELQELDFGTWEGHLWNEIDRAEINSWAADIWHYRPGGGESATMLRDRWRLAMTRWQAARLDHAVIITHAGVIRTALAEAGLIGTDERWNVPIAYFTTYELNI